MTNIEVVVGGVAVKAAHLVWEGNAFGGRSATLQAFGYRSNQIVPPIPGERVLVRIKDDLLSFEGPMYITSVQVGTEFGRSFDLELRSAAREV